NGAQRRTATGLVSLEKEFLRPPHRLGQSGARRQFRVTPGRKHRHCWRKRQRENHHRAGPAEAVAKPGGHQFSQSTGRSAQSKRLPATKAAAANRVSRPLREPEPPYVGGPDYW